MMPAMRRLIVIGALVIAAALLFAWSEWRAADGQALLRAPHEQEPRPVVTERVITPMTVGGEVTAPVVIRRPELQFEQCTRGGKLRVGGIPILEAVIDADGAPRDVRLVKGIEPCIDAAFLDSIRQSRFKPGMYRGKPVPTIMNYTLHIHLR